VDLNAAMPGIGRLFTGSGRAGTVMPYVIQDVLLMAGLIASFTLFLGMKREMRRQARRYKKALQEIEGLLPKLRAAAAPLEADPPAETEDTAIVPADNHPVRPGFNLQRRALAIRLLRRGEDIAHISAVLGVPRGEVELLIRVQQLAATRPVNANS
jgi:hypothetical protein